MGMKKSLITLYRIDALNSQLLFFIGNVFTLKYYLILEIPSLKKHSLDLVHKKLNLKDISLFMAHKIIF